MFAVHARAPFFVALGRLSNGDHIINLSSAASTRVMSAVPIYSAASINNLTQSLAIELGPRCITVNAVAPCWTSTDMNAAFRENADMVKAIIADTVLGRFGETSDISGVGSFLASGDARWVTGQVIEASGGYKIR